MKFGSIVTERPAAVPSFVARASLADTIRPVDWLSSRPADGDALGNDLCGNCDEVADYQLIRLLGGNCTRELALNRYYQLTGFDVKLGFENNPTDQGTDTNLDLRSWCAFPIFDGDRSWPIYWAQIDSNNTDQILRALQRFPLFATIILPPAIADDPDAWQRAPGRGAGWTPRDGHRVLLGGWDGEFWTVRTWGTDVKIHPETFSLMIWHGVVDVPIPRPIDAPEDFDLEGIDYDQLVNDISKIVTITA